MNACNMEEETCVVGIQKKSYLSHEHMARRAKQRLHLEIISLEFDTYFD